MLDLDDSYDRIHLSRCQHLMKHCLCDWVKRMCVCTRVCVCLWDVWHASQVLSIAHHQKFMYLSYTHLKKVHY